MVMIVGRAESMFGCSGSGVLGIAALHTVPVLRMHFVVRNGRFNCVSRMGFS